MNDGKHSDLSVWEYLACLGDRYGVAQTANKETSRQLLCIRPTAVCIEEWTGAWKGLADPTVRRERSTSRTTREVDHSLGKTRVFTNEGGKRGLPCERIAGTGGIIDEDGDGKDSGLEPVYKRVEGVTFSPGKVAMP